MDDNHKISEWNYDEPTSEAPQYKDITPGDTDSEDLSQSYKAMADSMVRDVHDTTVSNRENKDFVRIATYRLGGVDLYAPFAGLGWLSRKLRGYFNNRK